MGIVSYRYLPGWDSRPLFITETGWPSDSPFFTTAFGQFWTDNNIVAITPFILQAASGDFAKFSLLDATGQPKNIYREIVALPKNTGSPLLSDILALPPGIAVTSAGANLIPSAPVISLWHKLIKFWDAVRGLTSIKISSTSLQVEVADTEAKRSLGLSGRAMMDENTGMWFKFEIPGIYPFWMKDMKFPLDFIWIRGGKIVEIDKNIGIPAVIIPKGKVDQVIEVNAGWVDKYDIKEGDILTHEQN